MDRPIYFADSIIGWESLRIVLPGANPRMVRLKSAKRFGYVVMSGLVRESGRDLPFDAA